MQFDIALWIFEMREKKEKVQSQINIILLTSLDEWFKFISWICDPIFRVVSVFHLVFPCGGSEHEQFELNA